MNANALIAGTASSWPLVNSQLAVGPRKPKRSPQG